MKVKKWPVIGVVLALVWLFVKGATLTPQSVLGTFLVGLVVGLFVAYTTRNIYAEAVALGPLVRSTPAAIRYLLHFLRELLTANVDVAYRVLSPSLPIDPDVVAIPLRVQTGAAITTIANSITLTPGTLTMDYDEETNTLFVHAITGKQNIHSIIEPVRAWENLALVIFDEEADPEDPAPELPNINVNESGNELKHEQSTETEPESESESEPETETKTKTKAKANEQRGEGRISVDRGVEDGE